MTLDEFEKEYHLDFKGNTLEEMLFLTMLDKLYLEFTHDQAIVIVEGFLAHADDIYNDINKRLDNAVDALTKLFGKDVQFEKIDKKKYDA